MLKGEGIKKIGQRNNPQTTGFLLRWRCLFLAVAFCGLFAACSKPDSSANSSSPKFKQYVVQGERLYFLHCSNCHQKNGKGLGLVYPPLDTSDYMESNLADVICLIKKGKGGELIVNGKSYNQTMPGIPTLTDLEIAEIATYIFNSWSHDRGLLDVNETSKILMSCDSVRSN